jgi:hypothetical protein
MFSYISAEQRVPMDHPLRAIRVMVDAALKESSWRFHAVYAKSGRPSIAPEKLLRALAPDRGGSLAHLGLPQLLEFFPRHRLRIITYK